LARNGRLAVLGLVFVAVIAPAAAALADDRLARAVEALEKSGEPLEPRPAPAPDEAVALLQEAIKLIPKNSPKPFGWSTVEKVKAHSAEADEFLKASAPALEKIAAVAKLPTKSGELSGRCDTRDVLALLRLDAVAALAGGTPDRALGDARLLLVISRNGENPGPAQLAAFGVLQEAFGNGAAPSEAACRELLGGLDGLGDLSKEAVDWLVQDRARLYSAYKSARGQADVLGAMFDAAKRSRPVELPKAKELHDAALRDGDIAAAFELLDRAIGIARLGGAGPSRS
jgi:hypothetical protein